MIVDERFAPPLVDLDRSAQEAEALLDEAIAADAHPGRGTGGWINFTRGWLSIRQERNWAAAEGHMAARYRTEENAVDALEGEYRTTCAHLHGLVMHSDGKLQPLDVARMLTLLDRL